MHAAMMRSASRRRNATTGVRTRVSTLRMVSVLLTRRQRTACQRFAPNHPATLANDDELVRIDARDRIRSAARPGHADAIGAGAYAETHMDPQIVLRAEAAAAAHLVD